MYKSFMKDMLKESFKDCVMADVSTETEILNFINSIPDELLYTEESGYGREDWPHVTILYGLEDGNIENVKKIVDTIQPFQILLKTITKFDTNEKYDVLKIDVSSKMLNYLNSQIKQLPNQNQFPNYHAHLTLAYLKKGAGGEYVGNDKFNGRVLNVRQLVYSDELNNHNVVKKLMQESNYGGAAGGPTTMGFLGTFNGTSQNITKFKNTKKNQVDGTLGSGYRAMDGNTIRNSAPYDTLTDSDLEVPGIDKSELRLGIRREMEKSASQNKEQAKEEAISNLKKDPKYYSLLRMYFDEPTQTNMDKKEQNTQAITEIIRDLQSQRDSMSSAVNNKANTFFQSNLSQIRGNVSEIGSIIRDMQNQKQRK
jgi:uncharacterized protein YukE